MKRDTMKHRAASFAAALFCWVLGSALALFIVWVTRDRARLIRDNDNEQILSHLFTRLRGYEDFDAAFADQPLLSERIAGIALYGEDRAPLYRWGDAPPVFDAHILEGGNKSRFGRYAIPNKQGDRVTFVFHIERPNLPPQTGAPAEGSRHRRVRRVPSPPALYPAPGTYLSIAITHPAYRRARTVTAVIFPLCALALLAAVLYIRRLYLRTREYRERIEAQKNLVVLGTAASTLAHEIKNPLLSIRLQTGILRKTLPNAAREELEVIDEEVERLSHLIYRVNDFLREAEGNTVPLNPYDMLAEIGPRLCGRDILTPDSRKDLLTRLDPCRARSVFENIIRNALEAGGEEGEVAATVGLRGGAVVISVFDRGKGIPEADMKRIFDPFFTRKSAGTGIGLAISKRFVDAARGYIRFAPRRGGGTVVTIGFPEWTARQAHPARSSGVAG
ncbi:MAG: HAMP domain-containing histidine kinase [Spirochaetaceae bacterium]|jgi:two-component system sensor histidine kinase HydH|nr:HAMP domain-containing histidine kinase [Spirochaetaceae bacterium]